MSEADRGERLNQRQKELAKRDEVTRKTVIQALMNDPSGRRYIWLELTACNVFAQTYVPDSFDRSAFREGQRSRGNALLADVTRWAPNQYIEMTKENSKVKLEEENEDE